MRTRTIKSRQIPGHEFKLGVESILFSMSIGILHFYKTYLSTKSL